LALVRQQIIRETYAPFISEVRIRLDGDQQQPVAKGVSAIALSASFG